ncbi:MAG: nuclear transport factor 2 family protein [Gemmatimonadota bacterium]
MRPYQITVIPAVALLASCTIEETPQQYIDHLTTPAAEIGASQDEIMARLLSTGPALQRRDRSSLTGALAPSPDLYVIGPRPGEELTTAQALVDTLSTLVRSAEIGVGETVVSIGPGNDVAWFRTSYEVSGGEPGDEALSFSGVFVREGGEWRLSQGHLSSATRPSPPPAEPDTAAAGG